MYKSLQVLCFCLIFTQLCSAQMSAGFSLGTVNYQGDLTKGFVNLGEINIGYGLFVTKRYDNPKFALSGHLQTGKISGNDLNYSDRWARDLKFSTPVTYLGGAFEYLPFAKKPFNEKGDFVPQKNFFVSSGMGVTFFNPTVVGLEDKAPDKIAEISKSVITIPLTVGVRFDLDPKWSIGVQATYSMPFTDYLDGVSLAGSPSNNDKYFFVGISLAKKWGDIQEEIVNTKGKKKSTKKKRR